MGRTRANNPTPGAGQSCSIMSRLATELSPANGRCRTYGEDSAFGLRGRECPGSKAHRAEGAVEDVDAAGPGLAGGVQLRLSLANGEAAVIGPGRRHLDKAVAPMSQAEIVPFRLAKMKCAGPPFPPISHREVRGAGVLIGDLAGGSLGGSSTGCRNCDIAGRRIDGRYLGDICLAGHRPRLVNPLVGDLKDHSLFSENLAQRH
jgi:hypothetical protein